MRWTRSGSSSTTGRRSRSVRSALGVALLGLCAAACASRSGRLLLERPPPSPDLVGRIEWYETSADETLIDIAPELRIGYVELLAANPGVDPWLPPEGKRLLVPFARLLPSGERTGIVVNLGDLRLYHFAAPDQPPRSYPIGIAKDGYATPLGVTTVKAKKEQPTWIPGESARRDDPTLAARVPPGPDNPLGEHALYLGWQSYLIHGTNEPRGVGRHSSRGCIRLYPEDMVELYEAVEPGTAVRVVNEPVKLGWIAGELYLEVNPDAESSLRLDEDGKLPDAKPPADLRERVLKAAGEQAGRVDWARVERIAANRFGVPARITSPATPVAQAAPAGKPAAAKAPAKQPAAPPASRR